MSESGNTDGDLESADWSGQGYQLFSRILDDAAIQKWLAELQRGFQSPSFNRHSIQSRDQVIYAARNLLDGFPFLIQQWKHPRLSAFVLQQLGDQAGLVRGLYFDKPPGQSWSLPWHKDRTLAVRRHESTSPFYQHPTTKSGVAHVEADDRILSRMLTLRFHLDAADHDNGALIVQPGSHLQRLRNGEAAFPQSSDQSSETDMVMVTASAGDVLAMRPMLNHSSGNSNPQCRRHRRIVHLEFAADPQLPDGYQWRWFFPVSSPNS